MSRRDSITRAPLNTDGLSLQRVQRAATRYATLVQKLGLDKQLRPTVASYCVDLHHIVIAYQMLETRKKQAGSHLRPTPSIDQSLQPHAKGDAL